MPGDDIPLRICPICGDRTADRSCPADGAGTVRPIACDGAAIGPNVLLDGHIRVVDVIGAGGFARVYGGVDERTGVPLAIKVMSKAYIAADPDIIRRFVREADITSRLVHGNTIRVFDVGQTLDGQLLLLMERLNGATLTHRLRHLRRDQQPMPIDEAVHVANGVLSSLIEAHGVGLVHRDLKPDNVFLHRVGERGRIIKVIDFGVARREGSEMTRVGQVLGTPAYMSPEQARGAAVDGRADLYSVGVILFQCLTGRTPYPDEDNPLMTMMHHVLSPVPDPREFRADLDEALATIVLRALAKTPEERFADAAEMRAALRDRGRGVAPAPLPPRPVGPAANDATRTVGIRRAPRSIAQVATSRTRANMPAVQITPGHGSPMPPVAPPPTVTSAHAAASETTSASAPAPRSKAPPPGPPPKAQATLRPSLATRPTPSRQAAIPALSAATAAPPSEDFDLMPEMIDFLDDDEPPPVPHA